MRKAVCKIILSVLLVTVLILAFQLRPVVSQGTGTVQYSITASASPGGTISPSGTIVVNSGSSQAFNIQANASNIISSISVGGNNQYFANYSFTQEPQIGFEIRDEKAAVVNGQNYVVANPTETGSGGPISIYTVNSQWNSPTLVATSSFNILLLYAYTFPEFPNYIVISGTTPSGNAFITYFDVTSSTWGTEQVNTNLTAITDILNSSSGVYYLETWDTQNSGDSQFFYESTTANLFTPSAWTTVNIPQSYWQTPSGNQARLAYFNGLVYVFILCYNMPCYWSLFTYNPSTSTWSSALMSSKNTADPNAGSYGIYGYVWADNNELLLTAPTGTADFGIWYSTDGSTFTSIAVIPAVGGFGYSSDAGAQAQCFANDIGNGLIAVENTQDNNPNGYVEIMTLAGVVINQGGNFTSQDTERQFIIENNQIVTGSEDCSFSQTCPAGIKVISINASLSQYTYTISNIENNTTITASFSPPTPTPTPIPTPTPSPLPQPTLTVSCVSSTSYSGFNVEINGNLDFNGTYISSAPILLSYSVTGGTSWQALTLVNTSSDGNFSAEWFPSVSGNYLINATYAGNSAYSSASTTVSLDVVPLSLQSPQDVFSVESNSTVSDLAFNSTSRELSFTVSGPSGTTGYVRAYIAKSLIGDISTLKVYLDGNQLAYSVESQGDSWVVSFTYHHSTHRVVINLGSASSTSFIQSQLEISVIVGVAMAAMAIVTAELTIRERKIDKSWVDVKVT